ncbi:MAG TPA: NAD(P)H-hydrate dehydratase [Terriglobales bacterium]|nr:NAD(P)H-hydrate dehydratase [Terriglobales bacterium]
MKIVTAAEMREIDRITTERFGIASLTLMENAGTAVADFVLSDYPERNRIGLVCGKGNNGGDGYVAARKLHEAGREVQVLLLADPGELRGDAAVMFKKLPVSSILARSSEELTSAKARAVFECDLLIDAILGTGFRPPVQGLYAEAIRRFSEVHAPIVAVDIPSGADADAMDSGSESGHPVVPACGTVTFTAPKLVHVFSSLVQGVVVIAPIGSPDEAIQSSLNLEMITPRDLAAALKPRPRDAHKGMFGHVLVIGGSLGKSGAAAMAGMAALRAGAGLATVATPRSVLPMVAGFAPELMTEPLEETEEGTISLRALGRLESIVEGKTLLAIGPGISRNPETAETVRMLVRDTDVPVVLDADGLNAFEGSSQLLDGSRHTLVLTPHPGEMARLTQVKTGDIQKDRLGIARKFAAEHRLLLVLKGHRTLIAEPNGQVWVNVTGNPGMATGGMGDILTGLLAGMLAQERSGKGDRSRTTVLAGVYLHGLAGDVACDDTGENSLVATDLLGALPEAFRRTREAAKSRTVRFQA